ncbi:Calx-beta domain-containing protein, partial [Jatrophihabitans sp.]|uniref:beta strand repeat-containing protein n=1 Tax=Jatrophihabitans sp. TaxID=1932789 RepID=UPI0030C663D7|nr:endoglucanase [Jatrophihabitans sp.]
SGSLTATTADLEGADLTGSGTLTIPSAGGVTLGSVLLEHGHKLLNKGTATESTTSGCYYYCANLAEATAGVFENAGSWSVTGNGNYGLADEDGNTLNGVVNDSGATMTVNLDDPSDTFTVGTAFTNAGTVTLTTGTVNLGEGNTSGTTDTGSASLAAGTTLGYDGGSRTVTSGTVTGSGTLYLGGASVAFSGGVTVANLEVDDFAPISGSLTATNATLTGADLTGSGTLTIPAGGTVALGSVTLENGYKLLNQGTATENTTVGCFNNCANLAVETGSTFENAAAWDVTGNGNYGIVTDGTTTNVVGNDAGATMNVTLDDPSDTFTINNTFTNAGAMSIVEGTTVLNYGNNASTSDTGSAVISAGATLRYAGGSRTVAATTISGAGTLEVSGSSVAFTGAVTVAHLLADQGATLSGSVTATNAALQGVELTGAATMTIPSGGTVTLDDVLIDNGYRLLNQGTATQNTTSSSCGCSNVAVASAGVFENAATWNVTGNGNYGVVSNGDSSAYAVQNDLGATLTVALDSNSDTETFSAPFTNAGSLSLTTGQLSWTGGNVTGTTDSGTAALSAGTSLDYAGGARAIGAGTITGAGTLRLQSGTTTFTGAVSIANLSVEGANLTGSLAATNVALAGGYLTGPGTMTVGGSLTLSEADLSVGYRLISNGTATLNTTTSSCYDFCSNIALQNGSVFENAGTLAVSGNGSYGTYSDGDPGNLIQNDATGTISIGFTTTSATWNNTIPIANSGVLTISKGNFAPTLTTLTSAGALSGGTFATTGGKLTFANTVKSNAATLVLGASGSFSPALTSLATNSGSVSIGQALTESVGLVNSGSLTVTNSATWRVNSLTQSAGSLTVTAGATFKSGASGTAAVTVNGGSLTGSGTVLGAVAGAGTVSPGTANAGTLTVTGSYAPATGGTLAASVGATSTQLAVSGTASLAGTLALASQAPVPALGTTATLLTAGSVSGTFGTVSGADVPSAHAYWKIGYTATSVTATLTAYPSISVAAATAPEGNSGTTNLLLPVTLSAASQLPVTVAYATSDGTATAGSDYTAASGTLTFPAGVTTENVSVPVTGDAVYERDETFTLTLTAPTGATLGTATAVGTISNDDAAPVVTVGNATATQSAAAGSTATFPVTVSGATSLPLSVNYATSDGTALAGTDYTATSGTLTLPAGTTSGSITVPVLAKATYSANEVFNLAVTAPVDATIATPSATATITNSNVFISTITPTVVQQGVAKTVTVNGANFGSGTTVTVSGTGVTPSGLVLVSANQLTVKLTPTATASAGARDVVVHRAGVASSCTGCLTVVLAPTLTSVSPSVIGAGATETVTLTGTNFASGASVTTGAATVTAAVTAVTPTSITATLTVNVAAPTGALPIRVTNPDSGTAVCSTCLTITPHPVIGTLSQTSLQVGATVPLTLSGSQFQSGAVLTFGPGVTASVTSVTSTSITATFHVAATATPGAVALRVTNPDGGTAKCSCFTVTPGPTVTAVSPSSVVHGSTVNVTITGTRFAAGATVAMNNVAVSNVVVVNSTTITATFKVSKTAPLVTEKVTVTNAAAAGGGVGSFNGVTIT